jgi:hypothetical protein
LPSSFVLFAAIVIPAEYGALAAPSSSGSWNGAIEERGDSVTSQFPFYTD